jgi:hypothetical protein
MSGEVLFSEVMSGEVLFGEVMSGKVLSSEVLSGSPMKYISTWVVVLVQLALIHLIYICVMYQTFKSSLKTHLLKISNSACEN